jgi:prepilin-type N-terminal cleavage/methylation domain-containing protein
MSRPAAARGGDDRGGDDRGFGLVELLVATAIMTVVGAVFTTGVLQIYRTTSAVESRSIAQAQVSQALLRLDREVRYAWYISPTDPARPYVEYLLVNGGVQQCVQLRLTDGLLQRRAWTHDATAPQPTPWQPIASQVTSAAPFTRLDATGTLGHQQLTVDLTATDTGSSKRSTIAFTALNTDGSTAAGTDPCYDPRTRS